MPTSEIICVGTELLLGDVIDTNSACIGKMLSSLGVDIFYKSTVGDNPDRIKKVVDHALKRSDIVIICGGLGPTEDDITKQVVSEVLKKKLVVDRDVVQKIKEKFINRVVANKTILKQAMIPTSAKIIPNPVGTAPGIILEDKGKIVILLPGVPEELRAMIPQVEDYLLKTIKPRVVIKSRVLRVSGMGESDVNNKISSFMAGENPTVALLAKKGEVHIRITAKFPPEKVDSEIFKTEKAIRDKIGSYIFGVDDETLEQVVGKLLIQKNLTISLAESCSGGLVSHRLTNVSGISKCYLCGIVSYSNQAKAELLGVPEELIREKGAVSPEVAREMARGVRKITGTDISLGITGIAGPTGGTREKPVGLVYIALSTQEGEICRRYVFSGDRESIKWKASQTALDLLRRHLLSIDS